MKEIIGKILREEETNRKKIEDARKQAEDAIAKARDKYQDIVDRAIHEAKQEALARRQDAEKEFLLQKEKILAELKAKLDDLEKEKSRAVSGAASQVFSQLTDIKG